MYLQVDGPYVQGILMPFDVTNKHGYRAVKTTDFALDVFPNKPLLFLHMLNGQIESHGEFDQSSFEICEHGLWGRARADSFARQRVSDGRDGFSLGSMPHLVEIDANDNLVRFVVVEGSFGPEEMLANWPGTTTASIQSFFPGVSLPKDVKLVRGVVVMPAEETPVVPDETNVEPVQAEPAEPAASSEQSSGRRQFIIDVADPFALPSGDRVIQTTLASINSQLTDIETRVASMEAAPTRRLPETEPELEPEQIDIQVASPWDDRTLLGMLFEDDMKMALAFQDKDYVYDRSEKWYKALMTKVFKQAETDKDILPREIVRISRDEAVMSIPDRMISIQAYDAIHDICPYLQADEVMRTEFTNYGAELIPVILRGVFYHYFRSESRVFGLMEAFTPTSYPTYEWPVITGGPTYYLVKEVEDADQLDYSKSPIKSSKLGTDKVTFTAGGIGARTMVSAEEIRWSSGKLLDAMAKEYMLEGAAQIDWVLVNGDKTDTAANISSLNVIPDVDDKVLAIDGLRHDTIVTTTADSQAEATLAKTTPGVGRALMGSRGLIGDEIKRIVMLVAPESGRKFDALDAYESIADVGASNATLLNGQVGAVKGVPSVSTSAIELADADGKYDALTSGNNVKGQVVFLHRGIHKVCLFEQLFVKTEFIGHANAYQMFSRVKLDQKGLQVGGTVDLYNNTV